MDQARWIGKALHDLCQPLTALECRLTVGVMEADASADQTVRAEALGHAVEDALAECHKMMAQVQHMQQLLKV